MFNTQYIYICIFIYMRLPQTKTLRLRCGHFLLESIGYITLHISLIHYYSNYCKEDANSLLIPLIHSFDLHFVRLYYIEGHKSKRRIPPVSCVQNVYFILFRGLIYFTNIKAHSHYLIMISMCSILSVYFLQLLEASLQRDPSSDPTIVHSSWLNDSIININNKNNGN